MQEIKYLNIDLHLKIDYHVKMRVMNLDVFFLKRVLVLGNLVATGKHIGNAKIQI